MRIFLPYNNGDKKESKITLRDYTFKNRAKEDLKMTMSLPLNSHNKLKIHFKSLNSKKVLAQKVKKFLVSKK